MRRWNFGVITVAIWLSLCSTSSALSLQDNMGAWSNASEDERSTVARLLTVVASQGLPQLDEEFFASCIDFASTQAVLQSRKIGEIGSMCVQMHLRFSRR